MQNKYCVNRNEENENLYKKSNKIIMKNYSYDERISILIDMNINSFLIEDPSNITNNILVSKIIINNIPYFISNNRLFYSIYYDDDLTYQCLDDLTEIFGLMEEIGTYNKDTNKIIYKNDNVILIELYNIKYIITEKNQVFSYDNHEEIGYYQNNKLIIKCLDNNQISSKINFDCLSDISLFFDSNISKKYFYFSGQIYRKDNFTKGDLSLRYEY